MLGNDSAKVGGVPGRYATDRSAVIASELQGAMEEQHWYGVKCLIEKIGLSEVPDAHVYEERVVIFRASDFDDAMEQAEREASEYAQQSGGHYIGYCNAFKIDSAKIENGTEVYSVMREVTASPSEFITRYYDDGRDKHR